MTTAPPAPTPTPAQQLVGRVLADGWRVVREVTRTNQQTGGFFSVGYEVVSPAGRRGFLKALDYVRAFKGEDPAVLLNKMTADFLFERSVLNLCRTRRLSRVVTAIGDGSVDVDPSRGGLGAVQYLIFEWADRDLRSKVDALEEIELADVLRVLHEVSSGLQQLHGTGVAHQDIRPSNILEFDSEQRLKLADLGRSICREIVAPHEHLEIVGALSYAPPEYLYGAVPPEWTDRRLGADLYLLGSLAAFLISGLSMNALLARQLASEHNWHHWTGKFQDALPYLWDAHARVRYQLGALLPASRVEVVSLVGYLTAPDPARRGHPKDIAARGNKQSLARFISRFDAIRASTRAETIRRRA